MDEATKKAVLSMVEEALTVDPWKEHLAGNPIARFLSSPGQCVDVHRKLVMQRMRLLVSVVGEKK